MKILSHLRRIAGQPLRFKLTDPGKLLVTGTLLAVATGSLTLAVPIYHLFTPLVCLLVLAAMTSVIFRPRIDLSGGFAGKAVAGQTVSGRFKLTNKSRLPAYDISLGFFKLPASLKEIQAGQSIHRIAPGESADIELQLQPLRRGLYELDGPRPFTTFPFNIFRAGSQVKYHNPLLVLPDFSPLDNVAVPVSSRYQPGGISLTSNIGESPEYIGNRDYRPGDPLRRIDSRAWGRLAAPVVKEYQEEYYCRVALVLDTFVPRGRRKGPSGFDDLEGGVSLTAAVADAMSRGEYIIDIFAAGPDLYVFRAGRHIAHFENVLDILACVNECRKNPFEVVTPALSEELNNISTVIFILLDWDQSRENLVRTAVERGCSTKILIVRDKATTLPFEHAQDWAGQITQLTSKIVREGGVDRI